MGKEKRISSKGRKGKENLLPIFKWYPNDSDTASTKMLVDEAIKVLREINNTVGIIISRMQELSKTLPEYETVRAMGGIGDVLAAKLIAEIGDVRRFHSKNALIAHAGIDTPPYESGQFRYTTAYYEAWLCSFEKDWL